MNELKNISKIKVDIDKIENDLTKEKNISVSILRLDKIHHEISGNKLFKLHIFLQQALASPHKTIVTFGGAYSNHLAATAAACKELNLKSIGIVRGEQARDLSHTLLFCKQKGMLLFFVSREMYDEKNSSEFKNDLIQKFGEHILIPEGGFSEEGVRGAEMISNFYKEKAFTHICCAVGTATTLAGLIRKSNTDQQIIGFSALKNLTDFEERIKFLLNNSSYKNLVLINDYHFGGYAKNNKELFAFMNEFYKTFKIPTDFVYTAKMMYGVLDMIKKNYFKPNSKILCIHTGGLQGNLSLPEKTLNF